MTLVNREGWQPAPLSFAEMRAYLYGQRRALLLDFFAGLGGLTSAAFLAGGVVKHACNHWSKSWLAHGANFPQVEHELGDLSVLDPKRLPRRFANVLVAAPECRRHSNAHNWRQALMELAPYDPNRGEGERSRATMWCPQRWAAYHEFDHVVVENVVEVTSWNQFGNWVMEWDKLGYNVQAVCLNSAFFFAPQARDRIAIVATRKGLRSPDLTFCPLSWCWMCEQHVYGVQRYKAGAIRRAGPLGPVGKWGPKGQYLYHCPACRRICSPRVMPALRGLDLTIPAVRICDRKTPLEPKTMQRVQRGADLDGQCTQIVVVDGRDGKRPRPAWLPAMTQTSRQQIAACDPEPTIVPMRRHTRARAASEPAPAVCASGRHHAIVGPDQEGALPHDAIEPCATVTAAGNHMVAHEPLVGANHEHSVPRGSGAKPAAVLTAGGGGGGLFMVGAGRGITCPRDGITEPTHVVTTAHSGGSLFVVSSEGGARNPDSQGAESERAAGEEVRALPGADGFLVQVAGNTFVHPGSNYARTFPVAYPAPTQSTTQERALVMPPRERDGLAIARETVIASYYGGGCSVRTAKEPTATQTGRDRHAVMAPAGGTRQEQVIDVDLEPSPTRLTRDSYAVAEGPRKPSDIREWTFRMLTPKEAQAIMDLEIRADGEIWKTIELTDTGLGLRITNSDGVRLSGNAVCQTQWANILHRVFCTLEGVEDPRSMIGLTSLGDRGCNERALASG